MKIVKFHRVNEDGNSPGRLYCSDQDWNIPIEDQSGSYLSLEDAEKLKNELKSLVIGIRKYEDDPYQEEIPECYSADELIKEFESITKET